MTGHLVSHDLNIPLTLLHETATNLLTHCGGPIRRLVAGLRMPDWPEGTRRGLRMSLHPAFAFAGPGDMPGDALLAAVREGEGATQDVEGD